MIKQPIISVIVPVYNVEKYLSSCIESVLAQSFIDFELLLIDDGSSDACGSICDNWSQKDSRVRVFHQKNQGVSVARNKGLDEACGEYIVFVDSDDYIGIDLLKNLYEKKVSAIDSVVVQGFVCMSRDGNITYKTNYTPSTYIDKEIRNLFLNDEIRDMRGPVTKLYSRKLIVDNGIRFPLGVSFGEDTIFFFEYLLYCRQVIVGESIDYVYYDTAGSLTKQLNDFEAEYITFIRYHALLLQLSRLFEIDIVEMNTSFSFSVLFFQRSLITDYRSGKDTTFSLRTKHLRRLCEENHEFIRMYYQPGYKLDKLGKLLLVHKRSFCYNLYMTFLCRFGIKWIFGAPKSSREN